MNAFANLALKTFQERLLAIISLLRLRSFSQATEAGRSSERYRLIALAGLSGLTAKALTSIIGLVSVPLTLGYLGKEQYGLWMVLSSLVVWMQLTDFGISNGLVNALSEAHGRSDIFSATSYITTALAAVGLIAVVGILPVFIMAILAPWNAILNFNDASLLASARMCFLILGVTFLINLPLSIAAKIYTAFQFSFVSNCAQIISSLVTLLGLVLAIRAHLPMPWLVLATSGGMIVANLLLWSQLARLLSWFRLDWGSVSLGALKRIARSSIPLFLFQIGALLVNQMDNILIAHLGTLRMVADYNVLFKVYLLVFSVGFSLAAPFYPAIREATERRDKAWVMASVRRVLYVRLLTTMGPTICLLVFGDGLLKRWLHQSFDQNFGVTGWLCFMSLLLISALSSTLGEILTVLDDIWGQIRLVLVNAILTFFGIWLLLPRFGLKGVFGALAIASCYPIAWNIRRVNDFVKRLR